MNTSAIVLNTKLVVVYYNKGKLNLFRIQVDVTLSGLKDQLDKIICELSRRDKRSMDNVEYRRPSTDLDGNIQFTPMKLKNNDDGQTKFSIFDQYNTKGSIELDACLIKSFENILKTMIRPRTYEEIRAHMDGPEEIISLVEP